MQEVAPPAQPPEPDVAWTDYVDTVLHWWRFVVYGCLAGWVLVLLGAFLIPRDYECTAALALPTINPKQKKQEMAESGVPLSVLRELDKEEPKPGVPLATYKRLEKRLGDEAVLTAALRDQLSPRQIRRVIRDFTKHVSAITTNPRNDVERMTKDDTITGVQVYYEGHPEEHARAVVTVLAGLVRDAFVTTMVLDQIEQQTVRASVDSIQAMGESLNFLAENDSLAIQADQVARLTRESPGAAGSPREVVDVKEGGYRYLPPPTQLVGIRATEAYNAHKARLRAREAKLARLRLAYFGRLDERLRAEFQKAGRQVVSDPSAVMREELAGFLQGRTATDPEVGFVRQEVEGMAEMIATFGRGARVVQLPTAKARPRALPALAAALAVPLLLIAAALVGESWKRYHAARGVAARVAA
jgi:hypothetical protein